VHLRVICSPALRAGASVANHAGEVFLKHCGAAETFGTVYHY